MFMLYFRRPGTRHWSHQTFATSDGCQTALQLYDGQGFECFRISPALADPMATDLPLPLELGRSP